VGPVRASRLIALLLLLQARGRMTAPQLAAELAVSERTVYRDVAALADAGVPVYAEQGNRGGYRLVDGYRTRLTGLTRDEAEALFLSGAARPAADLGLADALAAAQLKVLAALPPGLRDVSESVAARFHVDAPDWFRPAEPPRHLSTVAHAVWTDRALSTVYRRRGDDLVRRDIVPLGLVLKNSVWYLVGRVGGAERTYRVDRFTEASLGEPVDRDTGFDLAGFWAARSVEFERAILPGTATVRLAPRGVRWLRAAVGQTAAADALATATEPDADGWVTVRLPIETVGIAHDDLLRLGTDAEVLDPPELRTMLAATAAALHARYASP
jgi:predicted DNA-binding transcriptional regulator YafY